MWALRLIKFLSFNLDQTERSPRALHESQTYRIAQVIGRSCIGDGKDDERVWVRQIGRRSRIGERKMKGELQEENRIAAGSRAV